MSHSDARERALGALRRWWAGSQPGVLLDFAPAAGGPRLYDQLRGELRCEGPGGADAFFRDLHRALRAGEHLAGWMAYELSCAWTPGLRPPARTPSPLAWFGRFAPPRRLPAAWPAEAQPPRGDGFLDWPEYWLEPFAPPLAEADFRRRVARLRAWIAAGDTYQVNFTFPLTTRLHGRAEDLYLRVRRTHPVGYGAFVRGGGRRLLSFSPELFFHLERGRITARPMKGTAARHPDAAADRAARRRLVRSAKERAENLMIVDLLRNDLGRVCRPGSITVPRLFQAETYRTVHQMTSTVTGRLAGQSDWKRLLTSLFPCGSVTGAPKIRTQQIIRAVEDGPRGVYTGAIGALYPSGRAMFSVPIRTLECEEASGTARLGVGSGITADSRPRPEYRECLIKAAFLRPFCRNHRLIETMLWTPERGFPRLDRHLARQAASAAAFGIPYAAERIRRALRALARTLQGPARVRVLVDAAGGFVAESAAWAPTADGCLPVVGLSHRRVHSRNPFLYHKTTNRRAYQQAWEAGRARGLCEVLFRNERGALTEGAISNLFVRKGRVWFTPPISDGLLPGVARAEIAEALGSRLNERSLRVADLREADEVRLSNAVRGWFAVRPVD